MKDDLKYLLCFRLLLREDTQAEIAVFVRLEGGRHHEVFAYRQPEACADLTQVDEGLRASFLCVRQEKVLIQVKVRLAFELVERQS